MVVQSILLLQEAHQFVDRGGLLGRGPVPGLDPLSYAPTTSMPMLSLLFG